MPTQLDPPLPLAAPSPKLYRQEETAAVCKHVPVGGSQINANSRRLATHLQKGLVGESVD